MICPIGFIDDWRPQAKTEALIAAVQRILDDYRVYDGDRIDGRKWVRHPRHRPVLAGPVVGAVEPVALRRMPRLRLAGS